MTKKQNRYELDPNSVVTAKAVDDSATKRDVIVTTIGFISVIILFVIFI